jgi:hypothetical protein
VRRIDAQEIAAEAPAGADFTRATLVVAGAITLLVWSLGRGLKWHIGEPVLLAVSVLAGTPHGAADGWLLLRRVPRPLRAAALVGYAALAAFTFALARSFPSAAAGTLLTISVWHFGERDRVNLSHRATIALGTAIVGAFLARALEAQGSDLGRVAWFAALGALALLGYRAWSKVSGGLEDFGTAVLVIFAAWLLTPTEGFVVYFACVHTIEHSRNLAVVARKSGKLRELSLCALGFSVAALGFAAILYRVWPQAAHAWLGVDASSAAGYFLALTVPHMFLLTALRLRGGGKIE